jgi:hypothetical protein
MYVFLAIAVPIWIAAMVASVLTLGAVGWFLAAVILVAPLGVYIRTVQWRMLTGRDPATGERWDRRER